MQPKKNRLLTNLNTGVELSGHLSWVILGQGQRILEFCMFLSLFVELVEWMAF